ncbi:BON domain-containing protein [Ottowia oryzae]
MSDSTKQRWLRTGLWAAALGLSVSACVPVALVGGAVAGGTLLMSADRRSSETQTADSTIESAAHEAIVKLLPGRGHVNVNSYYRKVLITGEVPTAQDKQTVEAAVRGLPGVQSVVSDLAVMPDSTAIQRSNDGLITSKVRARFVGTNGIPAGSIKIFTERGSTYLMGRLTADEAARATDLAAQTDGVQRVVRVIDLVSDAALYGGTNSTASPAADLAVLPRTGADAAAGVVTTPVTQPTIEPSRPPVQVQELPPLKK